MIIATEQRSATGAACMVFDVRYVPGTRHVSLLSGRLQIQGEAARFVLQLLVNPQGKSSDSDLSFC